MSTTSDAEVIVERLVRFIKDELYPGREVIGLHEPSFTGNEKAYVVDAIDSTFVSSVGRYVDRFEEMVAEYTGAGRAVAAMNGTAALHTALHLLDVGRGDLVNDSKTYLNDSKTYLETQPQNAWAAEDSTKSYRES